MKPLLNTLFVTIQGAYLARDGEQVLVRVEDDVRLRVPIHTLTGIVCFGHVNASPGLMALCAENKVALSFLTENGRYLARVTGPVSGNVLLRRIQYRAAGDPISCAAITRSILTAKLWNSRITIQRALRDHGGEFDPQARTAMEDVVTRLGRLADRMGDPSLTVDELRGREGEAADLYFGVFDHLIVANREFFSFRSRSRRPPLDPVNALLSFVYTLLAHDVAAALESVGLDPAVGYLHRDRPGRPSLALDLMEEFRAFLADRLVLSLINRQQVRPGGFKTSESGAVTMDDATRKEVLVAWQKRKQEDITHPFLGEKCAAGLLPYLQATLLARHLRGDHAAYPPFLWK